MVNLLTIYIGAGKEKTRTAPSTPTVSSPAVSTPSHTRVLSYPATTSSPLASSPPSLSVDSSPKATRNSKLTVKVRYSDLLSNLLCIATDLLFLLNRPMNVMKAVSSPKFLKTMPSFAISILSPCRGTSINPLDRGYGHISKCSFHKLRFNHGTTRFANLERQKYWRISYL